MAGLIFILALVGIPLYLVQTRGVKRGALATLFAAGFFLLNLGVFVMFSLPGAIARRYLAPRS